MPAYLKTLFTLALLIVGALALTAYGDRASAHGSASGYDGDDCDAICNFADAEDGAHRRHDYAVRRHHRQARRFEESHDHYKRDRDRYGNNYGFRDRDRYRDYVCDPDGDRCYRSDEPYWNYREYYRRHGYRWRD